MCYHRVTVDSMLMKPGFLRSSSTCCWRPISPCDWHQPLSWKDKDKSGSCKPKGNGEKYTIPYIHSADTLLDTPPSNTGLDPPLSSEMSEVFIAQIQHGAENIPQDFGSYWHDSIAQLQHPCWQSPPNNFHHILKVLFWIEMWWLWLFELSELIVKFRKTSQKMSTLWI